MARKKKPEEHANHERWLISYADFITLLFAFFTTMYALSSVNEGKYRVMSESLKAAFNPDDPFKAKRATTIQFVQKPQIMPDLLKRVNNSTYLRVHNALKEFEKEGAANVVPENRGVVVRLADRAIFDPGKDQLLPEAKGVLDQVAEILKKEKSLIRIEGHTDNIPIKTAQFPSNWELSSSRAVNVLRYLADKHGIEPGRLSALGFGEYRPIAKNGTPEGRAKNRRIDIVMLSEEGAASEPR